MLPDHYDNVALDAFILILNHVHRVIIIEDEPTGLAAGLKPPSPRLWPSDGTACPKSRAHLRPSQPAKSMTCVLRPAHVYGNADSTTTWYATRANWTGYARMSWPIPENGLRMPTTLPSGEAKGGFETRPYASGFYLFGHPLKASRADKCRFAMLNASTICATARAGRTDWKFVRGDVRRFAQTCVDWTEVIE